MEAIFTKRGRLEIISEILSICQKPAQKTHILYKCNLSYDQLIKYLQYLIACGLLAEIESNPRNPFHVTPKGKEFLEKFESLRGYVEETLNIRD